MGKVSIGDSCYPKVLAESYGSVLSKRLTERILSLVLEAIRDEVGLDLLSPDDEVRPGDRVVGRGGLDVEVQDGDNAYKEKHEEFVASIAGILGITRGKGGSESEHTDTIEGRVVELLSRVSGIHEAMRKIDQTYDEEDACEGVVALVGGVADILESVRNSVDGPCGIDRVHDNVVRMIDELEAARLELGVERGGILPGIKGIASKLSSTQEELVTLRQARDVAAPLLERLLGSPEVTAESVAAALAALGPAPEF